MAKTMINKCSFLSQERLERSDDVVEIGSQAEKKKQLDPVLAQRWEKLQAGKCVVNDDIGSVADRSVKLDPVLAKRWSKQQASEKSSSWPKKGFGMHAKVQSIQ